MSRFRDALADVLESLADRVRGPQGLAGGLVVLDEPRAIKCSHGGLCRKYGCPDDPEWAGDRR